MNNITPHPILDEVKNLITYSITNQEVEKQKFESLHCAILKKYFEARDIKINYMAKTIDLNLPMSNSNYTAITFECLDLENFLQACLKSDKDSIHFYRDLLTDYSTVVAA